MKIACLGWGSLIWEKRNLKVGEEWFTDGPKIPIEFCRQSSDGRLTLVITETAKLIQVLWAPMLTNNVDEAVESLRKREGTINSYIGIVTGSGNYDNPIKDIIKTWANNKDFDAVLYTDLPPKFNGENGVIPSVTEAIEYLKGLDDSQKRKAAIYIRNAPAQISTQYRLEFEKALGWND